MRVQDLDHRRDEVSDVGLSKFFLEESLDERSHLDFLKFVPLSTLPKVSEWLECLFEVVGESSKAVSSESKVVPILLGIHRQF